MVDPTVPASSPIQPTKPAVEGGPSIGSQEMAKPEKPFSLAPEPLEKGTAGKPTPMEAASQRAGTPPWTNDQMHDRLEATKIQYDGYKARLQGPEGKNLSPDHLNALGKLTDKLTPDVKTIAEQSGSKFEPKKGGGLLENAINWIGGAQDTFSGALGYLESAPNMNPADFLKMQYSVQRAAQRGELFASIIGSSVSGIKTLMSTQLG